MIAKSDADEPTVPLATVSEMLKLFAKAIRAHQLYLPNNPMHVRAIESVRVACSGIWAHADTLALTVTDTQFQFEGHPVFEEMGRGSDSVPWLLHKDGIRSFQMHKGFEGTDLENLLDVIQQARTRTAEEDDLLTLLWERDFAHFDYQYVDLATDGIAAPGAEIIRGGYPSGSITPVGENDPGETATAGGGAPDVPSPFARIEDYDTTLYFLEQDEIEYLQSAIRDDFSSDLRPSIVAALLDTLEQEEDQAVREEICGILEHFLVVLLSTTQYRTAAYLLRETSASVDRSVVLIPSQRQRLLDLSNRMSEPDVLTQLLQSLEDNVLKPPQDDLNELFGQLKSSALAPLLIQLSRTGNAELRVMLEEAANRLAMSHTGDLVLLISSDNEGVALEAIQRAGDLRSPAAVAPLAKSLSDGSLAVRKAAVQALVGIGSAGAMQAVERAVEDDDRDIRVIAVRAMADRQHRAAMSRVERVLKTRVLQEQHNAAEKAAFFDAYASLAGEAATSFFDGILSPKGFLSKKEDQQTRACAATALGKLGTSRALDILRRAAGDKDVVVRTAATRALRGNG
jgi:HEAT repeat protein